MFFLPKKKPGINKHCPLYFQGIELHYWKFPQKHKNYNMKEKSLHYFNSPIKLQFKKLMLILFSSKANDNQRESDGLVELWIIVFAKLNTVPLRNFRHNYFQRRYNVQMATLVDYLIHVYKLYWRCKALFKC
jgi:hypothetical protein